MSLMSEPFSQENERLQDRVGIRDGFLVARFARAEEPVLWRWALDAPAEARFTVTGFVLTDGAAGWGLALETQPRERPAPDASTSIAAARPLALFRDREDALAALDLIADVLGSGTDFPGQGRRIDAPLAIPVPSATSLPAPGAAPAAPAAWAPPANDTAPAARRSGGLLTTTALVGAALMGIWVIIGGLASTAERSGGANIVTELEDPADSLGGFTGSLVPDVDRAPVSADEFFGGLN